MSVCRECHAKQYRLHATECEKCGSPNLVSDAEARESLGLEVPAESSVTGTGCGARLMLWSLVIPAGLLALGAFFAIFSPSAFAGFGLAALISLLLVIPMFLIGALVWLFNKPGEIARRQAAEEAEPGEQALE